MDADRGAVHRPAILFDALHQQSARAPKFSGELPNDLHGRKAVAKLVDQGRFPRRQIGAILRIEQPADNLLDVMPAASSSPMPRT